MAQAFFERYGPEDVRAESAGTEPAQEIWPAVVEVMREVGIDIAGRRPKRLTVEMQIHADWAITMGCGDACPYVATMVEAWDVPDPAGRPIEEVRAIRDGVEAHIRELIEERLDAIRTDRTAHELRLTRLLPMLADEFADTKPAEEIRACADAVLAGFDGTHHRASPAHLFSEAIATAGLLLVIFSLARTKRANTIPAAVGAYIGAAYFFTSSASFANPAISIGRMFSNTFAGIAPASVPGFVAAQLFGGLVALALLRVLYPDLTPAEAAEVMLPHGDGRSDPDAPGPPR